ncbi:hypothetical protein CG709_02160, partial [Lachnotalea glycerini]
MRKKLCMIVLVSFLMLAFLLMITKKSTSEAWVQTSGPYGGYVHCFAIEGTHIYAGTEGGGIFMSSDNGTNWREVNLGLISNNVYALAISGTTIYAGTNGGVFVSDINDISWNSVDSALTNTIVLSLAVNNKTIYSGTVSNKHHRAHQTGRNLASPRPHDKKPKTANQKKKEVP